MESPTNRTDPTEQPPPAAPTSHAVNRPEQAGDIWSGSTGWIGGVVLLLLGVIFLLQNFGLLTLDNWWALFIFIPAVGALAAAWNTYRQSGGRWTSAARGSLLGGLIFTLVALAFLFNLDFGRIWPVFLILGGLMLLVNAVLPD